MLETSLQCGSNSSKQSKSDHKLTVRSVPNLALRKKWYYINLKGKTQGKGEKQGPSVENKPFFMGQNRKNMSGHFLVHGL